jgi:hypothetical protein
MLDKYLLSQALKPVRSKASDLKIKGLKNKERW